MISLFSATRLSAQDHWLFEQEVSASHDIADEDYSFLNLSSNFDAQFFFHNNEYFAPSAEGYTLVGYTLRPTVAWRINPCIALIGGLHALRYGGEDKFHKVWPYFAAQWQMSENTLLRIGNLPGVASHALPEALQNPEEQYIGTPELGAQFTFNTRPVRGHAWVNWRQFIFLGDTIPEKFTAGLRLHFGRGKLNIPFALIFNHIGGQISDYEEPMQSLLNAYVAPSVYLNEAKTMARLRLMGFHTMAGKNVRPFNDGWAIQPEVSSQWSIFKASVAWYRAHNFYAPHGNALLMSVSNYDPDIHLTNRSIFILKADILKQIYSNARFDLSLGGYYDTFASRFDYSYAFALVLTPSFPRRDDDW